MPKPLRTIEVVVNPYHALDSDGVPQAAVQMPGSRNYVGARLDSQKSRAEDRACFYFPPGAVKVQLTSETATAVLEGSLLVTNAADAAKVGLKDFKDPAQQLEAEKAKALKLWQDHCGPDAKLGEVPTAPAATPPSSEASAPDAAPAGSPLAQGRKLTPNLAVKTASEA